MSQKSKIIKIHKTMPKLNTYLNFAGNTEKADRIFNALSAGGTMEMAIADQPWGDYYGSFKDTFGVQWMVNYTYPKKSQEL